MTKDDSLGLLVTLRDGDLTLEPLREEHRAALKAVCAEDQNIWEMYALSYAPDAFDDSFYKLLTNPARLPFAAVSGGEIAGVTAWIDANPRWLSAEIGNTYLSPRFRQNKVNGRMKRLLIAHGFACGLKRIQLCVDTRNERSQAACRKIGATLEGVLRNHMITWTGYLRDSAVFSIVERDRERLGY
ncbi:RimJ/RimL family protein N-acetyltransferase [Novosphingobium hassiacum]|uniref:RimJ/RimL family protein N-acetyltransferase n=1 Tax=Novosphingobium hassiacum TaxID=173676 RepID=A0A7W5ZX24_9SPHN|nr:GNAT family protein [Novosphingobium hassiacum]MBB3860713.1 RimJ/RimL family protein N-acetyltransferase [Novosphingobium hassiacum]